MYSRVFVIKLLTGVVKANVKRVEVMQEPVFAFFFSIVEQCLHLNLELLALIESTFDLIYFFLAAGVTAPVHKLLSVLSAITRLPVEVFQPVASVLASGLTVLVSEYGSLLGVVGCWKTVIEIMNQCMSAPHAVRCARWSEVRRSRCYKSLDLMFGKANADALPPCAVQLLDTTLQSVTTTPDVFATLMEDTLVLNRNCWRIITQHEVVQGKEEEEAALIRELWLPILQMVCRHCNINQKGNCSKVLDVLRVGGDRRYEA